MRKRLQNKIAESRMALPVTAFLTLLVWLAMPTTAHSAYVSLLLLGMSSYIMVELNNRNALIRTYSRMVSCSFIVLTTCVVALLGSYVPLVVQLCMASCYMILFNCYQDKRSQGRMFYAFMFIGIASLFFIQILFVVPVLWLLSAVNLMAFNSRSLFASLLGLMLPYWFWGGYSVFTGDFAAIVQHLSAITCFMPLSDYAVPDIRLVISFAYVTLVSIIGVVHFLRNSYKDKIRTRMLYELIISFNAALFLFAILQPQHIKPLLAMMIINASVLVGHFITLTRTRLTNVMFILLLVTMAALTVYNTWIF